MANINAILKVGCKWELGVTKRRLPMFGYKYVLLQLCKQMLCMYYKSKEQVIFRYKEFSQ